MVCLPSPHPLKPPPRHHGPLSPPVSLPLLELPWAEPGRPPDMGAKESTAASAGKLTEANETLEVSLGGSLSEHNGEILNQRHQEASMCSDVENGEYKEFKIKSEIGCSREGEATSSESVLHLSDVIEVLISLDEPGIFMDPVDDSFAPNYSKIIKNPMCFLKMREKIYSQQYTSWRSFVEDFERICYNAMKYNQKRSQIWNAANTLLRQGKRYLEQQAAKSKKILGIFMKVQDSNNVQETGSLSKIKLEEVAPLETAFQEKSVKIPSDEHVDALENVDLVQDAGEKQDLNGLLTEFLPSEMRVGVSGDVQLLSIKQQGEEQSKGFNRASSLPNKSDSRKGVNEDSIVDIMESSVAEDVRVDYEDQATECSSSFEGTQSDRDRLAAHDVGVDGGEVESQVRDGNGGMVPAEDNAQLSRRKKRALTSEWKTYRRGIEWRCRWLELRVKELQAESAKYDEILNNVSSKKQQMFERKDWSAARTSPLVDFNQKNHILPRRRRRKAEDDVDLKSYMSRHPLFSRYERKKRRDQEEMSTEEVTYGEQSNAMIDELADWNRPEDLDMEEELGDEFVSEEDSMEQLLWHIESLQMHVVKLRNQLSRGTPVRKNPSKVLAKDVTSSSPRSLSHLSLFTSPRSLYGSTHLQSPSVQSGVRSGSKLPTNSSAPRRRNSDYDINNVVMPGNLMANYVEPARHAFIETPHWRVLDDVAAPDVGSSSEEDTDDELYKRRHAEMEVKERLHQYAPWSKNRSVPLGKGSSKSGVKGVGKVFGKGGGLSSEGALAEDDSDLLAGFGFVPKRKRRKRESRDASLIAKRIEFLYASHLEPLDCSIQDQATINMEDGKTNASSVDISAERECLP